MSILLYHSVHPYNCDELWQVRPETLRRQLQFFLDRGATARPLKDYLQDFLEGRVFPQTFAVTFDDGYEDFVTYAMPILCDLHIPTCHFICPAHAGSDNRWNYSARFRAWHMDTATLRALPANGVDVQPHGWSHRNFLQQEHDELEEGLKNCVRYFREELNRQPTCLAYPYGTIRTSQVPMVAKLFRAALSVRPIADVPPAYATPRIPMTEGTRTEDMEQIWQGMTRGGMADRYARAEAAT